MQETQGVTVIGYGTDEFPAFFTPRSGYKVRSSFMKFVHVNFLNSRALFENRPELFLNPPCVQCRLQAG
jgi:pseudouridine-5'-phosphate glycosidase